MRNSFSPFSRSSISENDIRDKRHERHKEELPSPVYEKCDNGFMRAEYP